MSKRGFTLIELLVVILITGILLALILPNLVLFQERARRTSVKNNLHIIQTSLEAYAADRCGDYPGGDADWSDDEDLVHAYFPGGDAFGLDGTPVLGYAPLNPRTTARCNRGGVEDMSFIPDGLDERGIATRVLGDDEDYPYADRMADNDARGSIAVLGYTTGAGSLDFVYEYAIFGHGRDATQPMFDRDETNGECVYFALHN